MASMFFNRTGQPVALENSFPRSTAFLVCGGPSLNSHDLSELSKRGVLTLAVNNAATLVRPQLWVCVDSPSHFADAIWRDPGIWKFVPQPHMGKTFSIRDEEGKLVPATETVGEMPAVFGYRRNEEFVPDRWLTEDTFNWGNHSKLRDADGLKGSRSVFLVALRLLHVLGVRTVFLVGCDFRMELGKSNYAFDQDRSASSVRGNNRSYEILNARLGRLMPHFDRTGFRVYNCTPNSGLKVFPGADYSDAIALATRQIPRKIVTAGMYDQAASKPDLAKAPTPTSDIPKTPSNDRRLPFRSTQASSTGPTVDFTTIVGLDDSHLEEWKKTWPTWVKHRPEILAQPLLMVCDGAHPESHWLEATSFVKHPRRRIVLWDQAETDQRTKMLTGLTLAPAGFVETPWALKLDTDVVAVGPSNWIREEWFKPNEDGRAPVLVAPSWNYSKPAEIIRLLDDWADETFAFAGTSRLNLPFVPGDRKIRHRRIISWCSFVRTDWLREVTALCSGRLPCPSHDTFLWYCAARRQDVYRAVSMRECRWLHTMGRDPAPYCAAALKTDEEVPAERTPTLPAHAKKLLALLERWFPSPADICGVEVGVYRGEMSQAMLRHRPNLSLAMVDTWPSPNDQRNRMAAEAGTRFAAHRRAIIAKPSTTAASEFSDGSLDFVFLDADHRLESVRNDLRAWWPKLKPGGLMTGHDYGHPRDRQGKWGVRKAADAWAAELGLPVGVCLDSTVWWIRKPSVPIIPAVRPVADPRATVASTPVAVPPQVCYLLTHPLHAPRLAVSIWSLRRHYLGPVAVYTTLPESHEIGVRLAAERRWNVTHRTLPHPNVKKNSSYLAKALLVRDACEPGGVFLDADTVVAGDISPLFEALSESSFVATRFMNWMTSKRVLQRRVGKWKDLQDKAQSPGHLEQMIQSTLNDKNRAMINSGVFAWRADSTLRGEWYELTRFAYRKFICDEIALQLLLTKHSHRMLDCRFNCSSGYGANMEDVRIWHFHGDRHLHPTKGRERWGREYRRCLMDNPANLREWALRYEPALAELHEEAAVGVR